MARLCETVQLKHQPLHANKAVIVTGQQNCWLGRFLRPHGLALISRVADRNKSGEDTTVTQQFGGATGAFRSIPNTMDRLGVFSCFRKSVSPCFVARCFRDSPSTHVSLNPVKKPYESKKIPTHPCPKKPHISVV